MIASVMQPPDSVGADRLFSAVYAELRALAQSFLGWQQSDHTLQATALVHEAYLRLANQGTSEWTDDAHFYNTAALAMRQLLADHARRKTAQKRGANWRRVTLGSEPSRQDAGLDLVELDDALARLSQLDPRQARIAELRLLTGLTVEHTAAVLGVCARTVDADWRFARAWLQRTLGGAAPC